MDQLDLGGCSASLKRTPSLVMHCFLRLIGWVLTLDIGSQADLEKRSCKNKYSGPHFDEISVISISQPCNSQLDRQ